MTGRRVIEAGSPAHECHRCAASALSEDLEAVAHLFTRSVEETDADDTRLARQPMSLSLGDEREIAGLEQPRFGSFDLEPASALCHHVEHQGPWRRRQHQSPRARELAATVVGTAHPQEIERLSQRID